ncbi:MAG TPA: DUF1289 domain-containing protein [Steroidobacteraceae bacterium]|nr:DUF1289 domain-containing protein [Steroidobacteraceae bacterium]HET9694457.1 DUF1289 domain-containing protein [Steroidobacteraceae bacterium]
MTQPAPASPCVNVCVLDTGRTCIGCGRTVDEIARWGRMSAAEQWRVVGRLERERQAQQPVVDLQQATPVAEG